jgi:hypothetical protein
MIKMVSLRKFEEAKRLNAVDSSRNKAVFLRAWNLKPGQVVRFDKHDWHGSKYPARCVSKRFPGRKYDLAVSEGFYYLLRVK